MKDLFFFFLITLVLSSCDKYTENDFSGVLVSDVDGVILGQLGDDDGDWQLNDVFTAKEESLFDNEIIVDSSKLTDFMCIEDTSLNSIIWQITPIAVYPTLSKEYLNFYSSYDNTISLFKLVIVDPDYHVLFEYEHPSEARGSITFKINLNEIGITLDHIHRVYYKIASEKNGEKCGHGDFIYTKNPKDYFD